MFETILLILIAVGILSQNWLLFKLLPREKQKEILRKIGPVKSKVIEWQPPQKEEEQVFNKALEELKQR